MTLEVLVSDNALMKLIADLLWGPICICAALFIAILANFIFRLQESHREIGVHPMSFRNAWDVAGNRSSWVYK